MIDTLIKEEYRYKTADKKLIIWGTGSLYQKIKKIFEINLQENVLFFVESSPKNRTFEGKEVISVDELCFKIQQYKDAKVLICTSAWAEIKETINENLLRDMDVYAPYECSRWIFSKDKFPIVKLHTNIYQLLFNHENDLPATTKKNTIAIMVGERSGSPTPYHAITLGVLLRLKGLNVCYLFNDLSRDGDLQEGSGFSRFQNGIIEDLLKGVADKYGIRYEKLSEQKEEGLTALEEQKLQQFIYYNQVWYSKKVIFDLNDQKLCLRKAQWLSNAKLIKSFLKKHHFDKVYTWTGIHSDWATFRILSESKKIKTYSSEYARNGYLFSGSGPTVFQKDVPLFQKKDFDDKQIRELYNFSEQHIEKVSSVKNAEELEKNSVLIPLNIFWDSAAFNLNDIFTYFDKWLINTIRFLIEECRVHVYIRQHPYERRHNSGHDVKLLLENQFGNSELFHFIDKESEIDTYSLIKSVKLILPNTSTVGIEAAMLGKQVIVKNEVYYANLSFVKKANTEDEYFDLISDALLDERKLTTEQIEDAKFYYALTMTNSTETSFGHFYRDVRKWSEDSLVNIVHYKSVQWFLDLILYDKPLLCNKLKAINFKRM